MGRSWEAYKRSIEGLSKFGRSCGRFPLTAVGKINTYSIFAETGRAICGPKGRVGIIVPSGIATDDTTKQFFSNLVDNRSLVSLYDFENREGVFPGVHRSYKFCLLTLKGTDRPSFQAEFAFFLYRTEQLQDDVRRFTLAREDFALFNPNTRTCPVFRTQRDRGIAAKMYRRSGVFWKEARGGVPEVNPWGVGFSQMFNMTSASHLFRTREQLEEAEWRLEGNTFIRGDKRYLPLYEAKLFHQYDHRFATFDDVDERALAGGNARDMTTDEKASAKTFVFPRYWVPGIEVAKRLNKPESEDVTLGRRLVDRPSELVRDLRNDGRCETQRFGQYYFGWLIAFRDIARATDERTAISVVVPGVAVSNKAPLVKLKDGEWLQPFGGVGRTSDRGMLQTDRIPQSGDDNSAPVTVMSHEDSRSVASALVLGNFNSLPLDWAARLSVGGVSMNFFIVRQLPVLPPDAYLEEARPGPTWAELVVPRVLELTYTAWDLQSFAEDIGYDGDPFPWDEERRHRLKCELDAIFAHMYQLERADLEWILDAPEPSASFPVLKRNELQQFEEYRTQRYVLQAYDQLAQGQLPDLVP